MHHPSLLHHHEQQRLNDITITNKQISHFKFMAEDVVN